MYSPGVERRRERVAWKAVILTMCVLLLIVAGVAGIVLRLLLLVMPAASAAAAKHLVEEAELGAGEGEE